MAIIHYQHHYQQRFGQRNHYRHHKNTLGFISSTNKTYRWPFPIKQDTFFVHLPPNIVPPTQSTKETHVSLR